MKLLTLAAVARQLGVCPTTAKKFLQHVPEVQVEANGRMLYRHDVLVDFIRSGGNQAVQRPAVVA
ncbi:hypothetical protein SBA4_3390020 [Candidatus Sulfopaludibacter sp. SbA4]|nr:hypothetical protein SBA4_3390020 [Candidatus Sulfopaludibacter sp. SbA4]